MDNKSNNSSTGLQSNIAGMLCYLAGFITGIIFIIIEKEDEFVRFHAMQSTILSGALFLFSLVIGWIPIIGWIISILLAPVTLILWIVLMVKAYKNELFELPVIGEIARNQINEIK